jgi:hypothetical protein
MTSINDRIIKFSSDIETKSKLDKNQKEVFHDSQLVYLWEFNHSKDIKEQSYMKEDA